MMSFLLMLLMSFTSCHKHKTENGNVQYCDSLNVKDVGILIEDYMNPSFTNITDVVCEHERICNMYNRDSVFRSIDEQIIANVANVLLYKSEFCTVQDIVDEYLLHKEIYDNILKRDAVESQLRLKRDSTTAPPLLNNSVRDSSFSSLTKQSNHHERK